jgi:leucyl aminopeptidase
MPDIPFHELRAGIRAHILALESLGTRYHASQGNARAQEYIETRLRDFGYSVRRSMAVHEGVPYASPWALTAPDGGQDEPFHLFTAHFDSISQDKDGRLLAAAPGADDNASGVAVVLELARALVDARPRPNVGFAFFNVEEVGQEGSRAFAQDWKSQGKRLDGVVNIDTIGTWPRALGRGGAVHYVSNEASRAFLDWFLARFPLPVKAAETAWEDDHASFWAQGYPAIELTEEGCTPVMHSPGDTSEKLDLESVATVAMELIAVFRDRR